MDFIRGLEGERKETVYSIESIRCWHSVQCYTIPPDKTLHERYRPKVIIDLRGRPESGGFEHHAARLVISYDELRQLKDAIEGHMLDTFNTLMERERLTSKTANEEQQA